MAKLKAFQSLNDDLRKEMEIRQYPVTFSFGLIHFHTKPDSLETMIQTADQLMYQVKKTGKNRIQEMNWEP